MNNKKKFIVSYAPFWHNGTSVTQRNLNIILAALPAVIFGVFQFGMVALGVVGLAVSSAMFWEMLFNRIAKRTETITDGNAALIGLLFAMLLPAVTPWWFVIIGTLVAVFIGKQIYGGIGGNPFNPVVVAMAVLMLSWKQYLDFDTALVNYDMQFSMAYPLATLKYFGLDSVNSLGIQDMLMGHQAGGLGSVFGAGLIIGGIYLIMRGFIRWEISFAFIAGVGATAFLFQMADPGHYAGPVFHLLTGYTLIGAFFLATEDSSSPVNFIPMLIYGAAAGTATVIIRNIGVWVDGVVFAILIVNLINPLLDKIRPRALGKVG